MEYQVPQFIEVEDKIFGPLTLRQFIYLAGGGGLCLTLVLSLPLFLAVILCIPVAVLALALAFYKMNGKPFASMVESGFTYYIGKRLYLWKKEAPNPAETVQVISAKAPPAAPLSQGGLSRRKLEELAWSLDVKEGEVPPTRPN